MTGSAFADSTALTLAGGPVQLYAAGKQWAPPVLLLHGAMLDSAELSWLFVAPELAKEHRVYAIDLPKHGGSRPWRQPITQDLCEQVIAELLDHLGLQRIAIVGTSMGAGVSIGYALNNPCAVTRLVLAAPGGIGARRRAQLGTWLVINMPFVLTAASGYFARKPRAVRRSLAASLTAGADTPGFDAILRLATAEVIAKCRHRERVLDDWQLGAYGPFGMRLDFLPRLGDLDVPTLWLLGQNDELVGAGEMQAAAAASGGKLETIPDAGHLATLDQPQYFAALAAEFLQNP